MKEKCTGPQQSQMCRQTVSPSGEWEYNVDNRLLNTEGRANNVSQCAKTIYKKA